MNRFDLFFKQGSELQLVKTVFSSNFQQAKICLRGAARSRSHQYGSFLWSNAVQAMIMLFIETACHSFVKSDSYVMSGQRRSFAHSLNLSLIKEPDWLVEMFGMNVHGQAAARGMFLVNNKHLRFGPDVEVSLNQDFLKISEVSFYVNDLKIVSFNQYQQLRSLLLASCFDTRLVKPLSAQLAFDFSCKC